MIFLYIFIGVCYFAIGKYIYDASVLIMENEPGFDWVEMRSSRWPTILLWPIIVSCVEIASWAQMVWKVYKRIK